MRRDHAPIRRGLAGRDHRYHRTAGSTHQWGFPIYRASHEEYQDCYLPTGSAAGTAEDALDTACGVQFGDPTA